MNKSFLFLSMLLVGMFIQSCTNDSNLSTYADDEIANLQNRSMTGKGGCFELIFPISILLPDSTKVDVTGYDNMKQVIQDWRKNNPTYDRKVRPTFVFPFEIVTQDGKTVTITSKEELDAVRKECKQDGHGNGNGSGHGHGKECFKITFPVTVVFPDGTKATYETGDTMKKALRDWKKANPTATERPSLEFPITVTLSDGTTKVVASQEELVTLKKDCK
jgi:hypothetical protein